MAETKSKPIPRKDKICVWTFPEGTQPAVRVEVDGEKIRAEDLLEIAGKTLGINANSLQFFGLFRGIENPTKKFGNNEFIYLPCRYVISIQKWSFDVPREQKHLKTDAGAMHLICLQCIEDIRYGRLKPKPDHIPLLKEYRNPAFPCDKQYVELCQKMFGYGYVFLNDCTIQNDVKMKEVSLTQGMQVDLIANRRGLMIKSKKSAFFAPWRKIRRWSQAQGDSIHFEIYFTEELRFEWVEVQTEQVAFLMSVIAEFVYLMKKDLEEPEVNASIWSKGIPVKKLTWKLIKKELFSKDKKQEESEDEEEPCQGFDNLEEEASTDDEESSDGEQGAKAATSSRRSSQYRFS